MATLSATRIRHSVVFALAHPLGSAKEAEFLASFEVLRAIPGVEQLEVLDEVSPKNDFRFAVSMEFADQATYDAYSAHPDHVSFVSGRWEPEVTRFLEIDVVATGQRA